MSNLIGLRTPASARSDDSLRFDAATDEALRRFITKPVNGTGYSPVARKLTSTAIVPLEKAKKIADSSGREKVLQSSIELKALVANLSMHLSEKMRLYLLSAIDEIYDEDAWYEDDHLISNKSFNSMLSFVCFVNVVKLPSLGVADSGEVMCSWDVNGYRLSLFVQNNPKLVKLRYLCLTEPTSIKVFSGSLLDAGNWLKDQNICI